MKNFKALPLTLCAFLAALTALASQLAIPLGTIPFNLATMAVFISGGLLGPKYGTISQIVFVALGAVGLPVFTGFTGGLGIIVGPTGGYIWGYITAAFLTGYLSGIWGKSIWWLSAAMVVGMSSCYLLGTAWFMWTTSTGLVASLMYCVVPFILGDILKIVGASIIVNRLRFAVPAGVHS